MRVRRSTGVLRSSCEVAATGCSTLAAPLIAASLSAIGVGFVVPVVKPRRGEVGAQDPAQLLARATAVARRTDRSAPPRR